MDLSSQVLLCQQCPEQRPCTHSCCWKWPCAEHTRCCCHHCHCPGALLLCLQLYFSAPGAEGSHCRAPLALCCSLLAARLEHRAIPCPRAARTALQGGHSAMLRDTEGSTEALAACRPLRAEYTSSSRLQSSSLAVTRLLQHVPSS